LHQANVTELTETMHSVAILRRNGKWQ